MKIQDLQKWRVKVVWKYPCTTTILLISCAIGSAETSWPQFRGPNGAGVGLDNNLPDAWSNTNQVLWKAQVPGKGWSCPVVWGKRVFVTSVAGEGAPSEPRKGLYIENLQGKAPEGIHRWLVHCLDLETGKVLWIKEAHKGRPETTIHVKNTYASATPVTDGERVYAYFGNLGLYCYAKDGKELWSRHWGGFPTRMGWGSAASPVLHEGRIFIVNDNEEKSFLVALDAGIGKEVWRVNRDEKSNWATPFIWKNDQRTELITCGSGKVRSYDLNGRLIWELGGMSSLAIPTPVAGHGLLYISSGYVLDSKRPVFAIKPGAAGDITLKDKETSNDHIAWCQKLAGPYHPSPLLYGDHLYVLYDRGFLSCYDARTGKEVYGRQRLGSSAFTASPWAYAGKIFCLSEEGDTFVIQAGPEFKLLGKNTLNEMCLATPAMAGDKLLIRTMTQVYCLGRTKQGK